VFSVFNIAAKAVEYIGTFEQVKMTFFSTNQYFAHQFLSIFKAYLDIAINTEEVYQGISSHLELCETSFLSNLAQTIPLPDFNQVNEIKSFKVTLPEWSEGGVKIFKRA